MAFLINRDPRASLIHLLPLFVHRLPRPIEQTPTLFFFWARNALYHGLRYLNLTPGQKVLVPAFHCCTLVDPILQYGLEVVFYNVFRDGHPDIEDILNKIEDNTKALVAVHFFGIPQPIKSLRSLCDQHGLFLIEDCAHILQGNVDGTPLGGFGEVSIFSWRKMLPIYDGGLLVLNSPQHQVKIEWLPIGATALCRIAKHTLDQAFPAFGRWTSKMITAIPRYSVERAQLKEEGDSLIGKGTISNYSSSFDCSLAGLPMSWFSRNILKWSNLSTICERRHQIGQALTEALSAIPTVRPWHRFLSEKICGWGFPMVAQQRDLHRKLRAQGIEAFTWEGVIHPSLRLRDFPDAEFLYQNLVILPNHQDLTDEHLQFMISVLQSVVQNASQDAAGT